MPYRDLEPADRAHRAQAAGARPPAPEPPGPRRAAAPGRRRRRTRGPGAPVPTGRRLPRPARQRGRERPHRRLPRRGGCPRRHAPRRAGRVPPRAGGRSRRLRGGGPAGHHPHGLTLHRRHRRHGGPSDLRAHLGHGHGRHRRPPRREDHRPARCGPLRDGTRVAGLIEDLRATPGDGRRSIAIKPTRWRRGCTRSRPSSAWPRPGSASYRSSGRRQPRTCWSGSTWSSSR